MPRQLPPELADSLRESRRCLIGLSTAGHSTSAYRLALLADYLVEVIQYTASYRTSPQAGRAFTQKWTTRDAWQAHHHKTMQVSRVPVQTRIWLAEALAQGEITPTQLRDYLVTGSIVRRRAAPKPAA